MINTQFVTELIPDAGVYFQLARFFIVLLIGLVLTQAILLPVLSRLLKKRDAKKKTRQSVMNLANVIGFFISFTVALQAGNFGTLVTIIGAVAAALTVAIGFGMRDQVSNIVAGFLIYLYNPFLVGDYIKSEDAEGVVEEITLVSTTLTGSSSQKVVVPNSQLMIEELKNYTQDSQTKGSIRVTLPNERLKDGAELLKQIANRRDGILESPEPDIFYSETEGAVYAELHYWLATSRQSKQVKSDILEEFNQQAVTAGLFDDENVNDNDT